MLAIQTYTGKVYSQMRTYVLDKVLNFARIWSQMNTTLRNRASSMITYLNTPKTKLLSWWYWVGAWYTTIPTILTQNGKYVWTTLTSYVSSRYAIFQKALKSRMTMVVNTGQVVKRKLITKFGYLLLYMGKPFTKIGNWFWKRHRDVLDWGNK